MPGPFVSGTLADLGQDYREEAHELDRQGLGLARDEKGMPQASS